MKSSFASVRAFALVACLIIALPAPGQDLVRITEFAAVNDGPFTDEDGDKSDWIELHNAGTNTVDLTGWYLTDSAGNLRKWRFPATNLPPNTYLVVFASNKDRRTPGAPLHTSYRLDAGGEFLGLVKPDGVTVVSSYSPVYPPQVSRVSYGIPLQQSGGVLLTSGAPARVLVPPDGSLGYDWTASDFDDAAWLAGWTGVGFETDGQAPFEPETIADAVVDFAGTQGANQWSYGYWNKSADSDGLYTDADFTAFPNAGGPHSESNFWNGSGWSWFPAPPPYTSWNANGGHPNANNGEVDRPDHWAIRRYVAEASGPVKITGRLAHTKSTTVTDWVRITQTGVAANSAMYIYLTAAGDGYIDDMTLVAGSVPESGANLLPNGGFESPLTSPWTVSANHALSSLSTTVKRSGNSSLNIVATAGGTTQASSIWQTIAPALAVGQTYTLSYWYRAGTNPVPLTVRFSGNWISITFDPPFCGDGVIGRIFVDGVQVWQDAVFGRTLDFTVAANVQVGSRVDFALDPGLANNDFCDAATFTSNVDTADPTIQVVADSVADWSFSGTQGERNWFYGYYNKTTDTVPGYQATNFLAFPRNNGPHSANNYWTGTMWDWFSGNPPWDEIGQTAMHPNGINNTAEHWVIRRWVSEVSGRMTVEWTLAKGNPGGNGVTGRIFHNGVPMDTAVVAGTDTIGVARSVLLTNVAVGDFIDIALDPTGAGGATDDSVDGSHMTVVVRGAPSVASAIVTEISGLMKGVNASAYIRIPFVVTNATPLNFLSLRMKYDDGYVAYLNGVAVAQRNAPVAPDVPLWNSTATAGHPDEDAMKFEDYDLTPVVGLLRPGTNVLAIHGLNLSAADGDFLILPELHAASVTADLGARVYFSTPTPGAPNGLGDTNLGPIVAHVAHVPNEPRTVDDLYVTAHVLPTFNALRTVQLTYRVMFSNEVTVSMFDDGLHADGVAGDGIYGGTIPAGVAAPGQMVRYFVYATDLRTNGTRIPSFLDVVNSPQYHGTVVADPSLTNGLPVLHWFIQAPSAADTDAGTKCMLFFLGRFYDNCGINVHGQSSRGFPKKSYDIDFNPGYNFIWREGEPRADDINLLTTWADKSHMRNTLAYDSYVDADAPSHWAFAVRVQQNGAFFSVANIVENGDENYLDRLGLDPRGALYKMYSVFTSVDHAAIGINVNAEKKTRKEEGNADLVALFNGVSQSGQALISYVFDNVDVPQVVNFLAGHVLQNDEDCCHKNYYFYRDTEGNKEWKMTPWDVDLSFGRTWTPELNYFNPTNYATNRYSSTTSLDIGMNNRVPSALNSIPWIRQMYLRRVRTITDEQLQPLGTHPYLLHYENKVEQLAAPMYADAALDLAKWGSWAPVQNLAQAVEEFNARYFPWRRRWIYTTLSYTNGGPYMAPQPTDVAVLFGTIEANPASRNQAQEYIQLVNPNPYPVDLSGWRLAGAVDYRFKGGVVLPTNGVLYVSPDVNAFRTRATAPRGGMGLFVQGNYQGQLNARGEVLQLVDSSGRVVQTTNTLAAPSLPQQYLRITEIMYHPAHSRPASGLDPEQFEYLELKNTGPSTMSLVGVHFTNGIEFAFAVTNSVTSLAAGEAVVLVRNVAAFTARYGSGPRIAGQYAGALDNAGENLRLDDANGEKILDFRYENQWYPITDGFGFSLVIVDETAPWTTWDQKASWRPSGRMQGSPGADDPAPFDLPGILVNELLSNSDAPAVDAVELYNPASTNVDLGGWFITDDFTNAFKYRIPSGTVITAGTYRVFTEADFNPGGTGFAFRSSGDEVYLFSGDASTNLTGYRHGFDIGAAETGVSFGRHVTSQGDEHFVAQRAVTFNATNAGPKVEPVIISEIMFRPPDLANSVDNQDDEFIELRNVTATNVPLYDLLRPANTWRLHGGVDFTLPSGTNLPPGGTLLLVSFNPTNDVKLAAFRARYGVAAQVPILGPYSGKLDNSADNVRLSKPDAPLAGGKVPYILVDEVEYEDSTPWPDGADGTGASIQRTSLTAYGNDPVNWTAAVPTAGGDLGGGVPPVITVQPMDLTVVGLNDATFSVTVTGTEPLAYQWRRDGVNVAGATNATFIFNAQPLGDARYSVAVFNPAGTVFSSNAALTVLLPAKITSPPLSRTVFPRTNVTFSVLAGSVSPIQYQWLSRGTNIPGATGTVYSITNVQPNHEGDYAVRVTDATGSFVSPPARLTVVAHPQFTVQPSSRTAVAGAAVTLPAAAVSSTPVRYQWLFNGTNLPLATNASLTISNVVDGSGGDYAVVASDSYGSITSVTATITVVIRPTIVLHPTPTNQVLAMGESLFLTANATGTEPMLCRWRRNGNTNIAVNSGFTLSLSDLALTEAGYYDVVVTNVAGAAIPNVSTRSYLTMVIPPTNQNVLPGADATLRAILRGPGPITNRFWWLHNGTNVLRMGTNQVSTTTPVAFTNDLALPGVTEAQAGQYTFLVSNVVVVSGSVVPASRAFTASLTVGDPTPPSITAIELDGTNAVIRWPEALGSLTLEEADALTDPPGWETSDAPRTLLNGEWRAVVPVIEGTNKFFRLKRP